MKLDYYNHTTELPGTGKCITYNFLKGFFICHSADKEPSFVITKPFSDTAESLADYDVSIDEIRDRFTDSCRKSDTLHLVITPTMDCNFDCPYCFESHRKGRMSEDVQSQLLKFIRKSVDLNNYKVIDIKWFGGEPLLGIDVIENLTRGIEEIAENRDIYINAKVMTNAYLFDRKMADRLEACHVSSILTTVDGIGEYNDRTRHLRSGEGSFGRIEKNLLEVRTPIRIAVRTNLHRGNLNQRRKLEEWVAMLKEKTGNDVVACLSFVNIGMPVFTKGEDLGTLTTAEFVDILSEDKWKYSLENPNVISRYACVSQSFNSLVIDENGDIYKCEDSVGKAEYIVGNVWDGVDESKLEFFNKGFPDDDEECLKCKFLTICYGGCPNSRLRFGKKICCLAKYDTDSYVLGKFRKWVENDFTHAQFENIEKIISENNLDYWVIMYYLKYRYDAEINIGDIVSSTDFLPELAKTGKSSYMLHGEYIKRMLKAEEDGYVDFSLRDKTEIFRRMPELMRRDYLDMSKATQTDVDAFVREHMRVVAKTNKMASWGFAVYTCDNIPTVEELHDNEISILETYIIQHEEYNKIFSKSVCSIRIDTLNVGGKVKFPFNHLVTIGEGDAIDNGRQLNLMYRVMIDKEGKILQAAHQSPTIGITRAERHGDTGYEFTRGKKLPFIPEARKLCAEAAKFFPKNAFTAWDVAITPDGPVIIEGNSIPGAMEFYQVLNYFYEGHGCRNELEEVINEIYTE